MCQELCWVHLLTLSQLIVLTYMLVDDHYIFFLTKITLIFFKPPLFPAKIPDSANCICI